MRQPEGFSPLKPLIDFGKALGFITPPDRYEEAKRTLDAEKAKVAEAEGAKTGVDTAGDDILIESEIRKSATGETRDTTVLRNNPDTASQEDADKKKEEQKKKRYTKKTP